MNDSILSFSPPPDFADWVASVRPGAVLSPLPGDASARRYFRAAADRQTWMAMHSPLSEKPEQFFAVGKFLSGGGLRAPAVVAAAPARGFFLLEDFGDNTYLSALQKLGERKRDELAALAMDALVKMQTLTPPPGLLPIYDNELLTEEMNWYPQWYRSRHCGRPLGKKAQEVFARSADWLRLADAPTAASFHAPRLSFAQLNAHCKRPRRFGFSRRGAWTGGLRFGFIFAGCILALERQTARAAFAPLSAGGGGGGNGAKFGRHSPRCECRRRATGFESAGNFCAIALARQQAVLFEQHAFGV